MKEDDLDLLEQLLQEEGIEDASAVRIHRRGATEARASPQQQRLWFLHRLESDSAAYNIAAPLRLSGVLNASALERAIELVVHRHEILRTTFRERDGYPWQIVTPAGRVRLECEDWRDRRLAAGELDALVRGESNHRFDLERGPLLRVRLVRLADAEAGTPIHLCLVCLHHIIADGWSIGLLLDEILEGYRSLSAGRVPALAELPVQYADYAAWRHEQLDRATMEAQFEYWRTQLRDLPVLDLPTDYPRPRLQTFAGDMVPLSVPAEVAGRLRRIGGGGTTLYMVLTAAFGVLLARHTRQREVVLGTSVAQRGDGQTHGLIGFLVNMLVIRFELCGEGRFAQLLDRVRDVVVDALAHSDLPYESLVERLQPERDPSRNPLFQVALTLLNAPKPPLVFDGLAVETLANQMAARFDLEVLFQDGQDGELDGVLSYNTDLFLRATAEQIARELCTLLTDIAADPQRPITRLRLLSREQCGVLIAASAGPCIALPSATMTLPALFEAQVTRTPDAIALVFADQRLSYRELEARANRLARCLIDDGVGPESIVALLLDRSPDLIVAMLAVLKAGAAYVPLDPGYPAARLRFMLQDSRASRLITIGDHQAKLAASGAAAADGAGSALVAAICLDDRAMMARLAVHSPAAIRDDERTAPLHPANLAYLIYTSGSTGTPKGVAVSCAGLINYLDWASQVYAPASGRGTPFNLSVSFDASVTQIYLPLLSGSPLYLIDKHNEIDGLLDLIRSSGPFSFIKTTPTIFGLLSSALASAEISRAAPVMILGGEALDPQSCAGWRAHAPETRLWNEYGPTETVVGCAVYLADPNDQDRVPIGHPIWNTQLYLLDESLEPVSFGSVGELYIAGAGLARGYHGRAGPTAERFIACPFGPPGARMYRTGDLARRRVDGALVFLGRLDDQIKLRGFRIELGEIESVLAEHNGVERAVVMVRHDSPGEQRLVAYVVPGAKAGAGLDQDEFASRRRNPFDASCAHPDNTTDETIDITGSNSLIPALREHATARLPDYMVPAAIVLLDALPLTPNGKLDRKSLPAPDAGGESTRRLIAPRTPTERLLCSLFAEVLGLEQVGIDGNFFALGGHSLLATRLISRIRTAQGVEIPVRALFEAPTVAGVAALLGRDVPLATLVPIDAADAPGAGSIGASGATVARAPRDRPVPLLPAQTRLWFLDLMEPGNAAYNVVSSLRLRTLSDGPDQRGGLDEKALRCALDEIVRRHEILRTVFRTGDDGPVQIVGPPRPFDLHLVDHRGSTPEEQAERGAALARRAAHHGFDLSVGPLALGWLVRLADGEHRLLILMHHIVADGWSFGVVARELRELYAAFRAGRPSPLPELPIQYADFACWQHARLAGPGLARQREYWLQQLADLEPVEILPLDRSRKPQSGGHGETLRFVLEPALERGLMATATRHGATLFMSLLAALAAVLHRSSGATDLPIGTPVAGRDRAEVEALIGFFVNTLVLRVDARGDPTLVQFLARVREVALGAYSHRDLPFEEIVERVAPPRHRGRHPLFGVMIVLQNAPGEPLSLPGLSIESEEIDTGVSKFDLTLVVEPSARGLDCVIEYDADLLERATVEQLASRFMRCCTAMVQQPHAQLSALQLESEAELVRRRQREQGPALVGAPTSVPDVIFKLATRQPDAVALCWEGGALSYGELARRVRRTAAGLQAAGVPAGGRVGAAFERSWEMIVALLGIMHAGAAYVPLDSGYPAGRVTFTIEDSGACLILAAEADTLRGVAAHMAWFPQVLTLADLAPDDRSGLRTPSCDRLAYVIHTSGSTGAPKGVMVSQSNLWASTAARLAFYGEQHPRFALLSSFAFDSSAAGIFGTLCAGGTLVLPPPGAERDPARLLPFLQAERVTQSLMLPALYLILLDAAAGGELDSLQTVIVAGEDCPPRVLERHRRVLPHARLANEYGPTEASVWCTVKLWPATGAAAAVESEVTIGSPIPGAHVWICDTAGEPAPLGVAGELCIGGPGVALGYAGRPGRTAESFVPDPQSGLAGARCYRSGDRARFTASGEFGLLGRIDRQIKVRGFRVEPGEVEAQILHCGWVREVAVTTMRDTRDRLQLVAHLVPAPEWNGRKSDLRSWLADRVPAHLLPAIFVWHDELPRTAGGKVDHAALEASSRLSSQDIVAAPRDHLELQLVRVWEDLLGAERIGIDDDFFELGGHSLLAVELVAEVRRRLGRDVPLAALFSTGTVARLAETMRAAESAAWVGGRPKPADALVPLSSTGASRPLFLVHQAGGNVMSYLRLARSLGPAGLPLLGLQARGLDGREKPLSSIEAMAAHYVDAIRRAQPAGPYRLGGHSLGGRVAQEMARQLEITGQDIEFLAVIDVPGADADVSWVRRLDELETLAELASQIGIYHGRALDLSADDLCAVAAEERIGLVVTRMKERQLLPASASTAEVSGLMEVYKANMRAIVDFTPQACRADIHVFATRSLSEAHPQDLTLGWGTLTRGIVHVVPVPGEHMSLLAGAHTAELARLILQACGEATGHAHSTDSAT